MVSPGPSPHAVREAGIREHDRKEEIGHQHSQNGEFKRASTVFQENLTWSENALGPRDPVTLDDQELLSFNLHELGRYEQAEALNRRTLRIRRAEQGNRNADTLETQHRLAFDLFKLGRYKEAADLDRKTLKIREEDSGPEDAKSLSSRHNLAASLQELQLYGEAADLNRNTLRTRERKCQKDDDDLIASRHNLAANLFGLAQFDDAANLLQQNLKILRQTRRMDDPHLVQNENSLHTNLRALSRRTSNVEADRESKDGKRRKSWDTKALQESKSSEQKAIAKVEIDQEPTVAIAGGVHESPRCRYTRASSTAATHGSNSEESAGAENKRLHSINHESRPGNEKSQGKLQRSARAEESNAIFLGNSEKGGLESTPLSHKRPSSASEAVMAQSTRIRTTSTPAIMLSPQIGNVDQDDALSRTPAANLRRSRAKSDQNLAKCRSDMRQTPITETSRPLSVGPRLEVPTSQGIDEKGDKKSNENSKDREHLRIGPGLKKIRSFEHGMRHQQSIKERPCLTEPNSPQEHQNVEDHPILKFGEAPITEREEHVYSSLCDAQEGLEDPYICRAADDWFESLRISSQALLEPYRKDRMRRVKIAILDTGIDSAHAGIKAQWDKHIKGVKSWVAGEGGDRDRCGHGTHAAALLMKIAPEASIYVARVVKDTSSSLNSDNVASAIIHAADEWKVDIITMSFGYPKRYKSIERAIEQASSKNVIMFASASNSGANRKITFPASSSRVICINSADGGGAGSRYNPPPLRTSHNFSALGEAVSSAWPIGLGKGAEKRQWGTSTSTPIAAAVAALVLEFARQPLLRVSHGAPCETRLKTLEGMKEIFSSMSEEKNGYNFIVPWKLLEKSVGRDIVAFRISDILYKFFGEEDSSR